MARGRTSWLDADGGVVIDDLATRLEAFVEAMADGVVSDDEVAAQERKVADLMREVEPKLDDAQHAIVTRLLCELSALDIMQTLHAIQGTRPRTSFRG